MSVKRKKHNSIFKTKVTLEAIKKVKIIRVSVIKNKSAKSITARKIECITQAAH